MIIKPPRLAGAILVIIILMAPISYAATFNSDGNDGDTPTGTNVVAASTFETLSYKNLNGTQMTTVEPSTGNDTKTTTAEYGLSGPGALADVTVTPGDVLSHYYAATNEGNANDTYILKHYFNYFGGASGWAVEAWEGAGRITTLAAGSITQESRAVSDNADKTFYYKVFVASTASNNSYILVTTTIETTSTPVGRYRGANQYYYGGTNTSSDEVKDLVSAPILTLTRTSTIDAPTAYTGGIHDAVPGAVFTFTLTYGNSGNSSAESVVLVDKIPTNTKLAHANTTGAGTNVTITAAQGTSTGWVIKYSTLDNPSKVYGNTADWSGGSGGTIGTLTTGSEEFPGGNATYVTIDAPYGAKWIKWEKQYVDPAEDDKKLTWGVTIR